MSHSSKPDAVASGARCRFSGAALGILAVCTFPVLCGLSCGKPGSSTPAVAANPRYLEIVGVSREVEGLHVDPVEGPDGVTWYREKRAGLDLSQCSFREVDVMQGPEGKWSVVIPLRDAVSEATFRAWLEERAGQQIGVFLDGRLKSVMQTSGTLHGPVWISVFVSREAAEAEVARMRAGGILGVEQP